MKAHIVGDVQKRVQEFVETNSATLLTAGGVVGVVGTAVLTGRASVKAVEIIREEELKHIHEPGTTDSIDNNTMGLSRMQKLVLVGPYFIPPIILGSATIGSIIMANRISAQKAAALAAAYGMAQKHFEEYKEKVTEKLGIQKEQKIQDDLAQDRVNRTPGASQIIVVEGEVLCFDQPTGRYFRSTMEAINRAVNSTNAEVIHHDHVSTTYFYEELGLPPTTWTDDVGWNSDNLVELSFSTVMSEDNRPCIAIDFTRLPTVDYMRNSF